MGRPRTTVKGSPYLLQLEKACEHQQRPSAATLAPQKKNQHRLYSSWECVINTAILNALENFGIT